MKDGERDFCGVDVGPFGFGGAVEINPPPILCGGNIEPGICCLLLLDAGSLMAVKCFEAAI